MVQGPSKKTFFFVLASLRFKVGDKVTANVGSWKAGKIIALWEDDQPYRIALNDGPDVLAPMDDDQCVRCNNCFDHF